MQMHMGDFAFGRGIQRMAELVAEKAQQVTKKRQKPTSEFHLVSWQPGARSRREDELARARQQMLSAPAES